MAVGPDGSIYAGSDGEGLIYRVDAGTAKRPSSSTPLNRKSERCSWGGDGALYAGTAAEAGGGNTNREVDVPGTRRSAQFLDGPPTGGEGGLVPPGSSE